MKKIVCLVAVVANFVSIVVFVHAGKAALFIALFSFPEKTNVISKGFFCRHGDGLTENGR